MKRKLYSRNMLTDKLFIIPIIMYIEVFFEFTIYTVNAIDIYIVI